MLFRGKLGGGAPGKGANSEGWRRSRKGDGGYSLHHPRSAKTLCSTSRGLWFFGN